MTSGFGEEEGALGEDGAIGSLRFGAGFGEGLDEASWSLDEEKMGTGFARFGATDFVVEERRKESVGSWIGLGIGLEEWPKGEVLGTDSMEAQGKTDS